MDMSKDLAEAEEELERVKSLYEQELEYLKIEKLDLEEELSGLKSLNTEHLNDKTTGVISMPDGATISVKCDTLLTDPAIQECQDIIIQLTYSTDTLTDLRLTPPQRNVESEAVEHSPSAESFENSPAGETAENLSEKIAELQREIENVSSFSNLESESPKILMTAPRSTISLFASRFRDKNDVGKVQRAAPTRQSVANEFCERMKRDQRFQKIREGLRFESSLIEIVTVPELVVNLSRSPLSPVKEDFNSVSTTKKKEAIWESNSECETTTKSATTNTNSLKEFMKKNGPTKEYSEKEKENSPKKLFHENEKENSPRKNIAEKENENLPKKVLPEKVRENSPRKGPTVNEKSPRKVFAELGKDNSPKKMPTEKGKSVSPKKAHLPSQDRSGHEKVLGTTNRTRAALMTSPIRDRIAYWEKEKENSAKESDKGISWEKTLRGSAAPQKKTPGPIPVPPSNRFLTSPVRPPSPLTRLGKIVETNVSQLADPFEVVPSPVVPTLPPRPPVSSPPPAPLAARIASLRVNTPPVPVTCSPVRSESSRYPTPPMPDGVASPPSRAASIRVNIPPPPLDIPTAAQLMPPPHRVPSTRIRSTRVNPAPSDIPCPDLAPTRIPSIRIAPAQYGTCTPIVIPADQPPSTAQEGDGSITPRTRAKCVSARNVISTRIDHKVIVQLTAIKHLSQLILSEQLC